MKYRWLVASTALLALPKASGSAVSPNPASLQEGGGIHGEDGFTEVYSAKTEISGSKPDLLAQCLFQRGIQGQVQIEKFLHPRLRDLSDPFLLPDMQKAVDRLFQARERHEPLVIFGDYDVDGVTATALLVLFLRRLGWQCIPYLPHRMEEGYGLSAEAVDRCLEKYPVHLLLAVDCGSTATQVIKNLADRGVDVVVLDHHQISDPAPQATALVNPHRTNASELTFRNYCSAGLAFKLAHAILKKGRENPDWKEAHGCDLKEYLDLVALGTVADMVPLLGENRIFVRSGLERLSHSTRAGIRALKEVAGIPNEVGAYQIGFQLGPRLNAAGRLESALDALNLLLTNSEEEAFSLASKLNAQNQERQALEQSIFEQVKEAVLQNFDPERHHVIVAGKEGWHVGVVGIVASRILREFQRPVVVFGGDGGPEWRGSGRSIEGIDLASAFRECSELLVKHGGHAMAAGLTILPGMIDCFREKFEKIIQQKNCAELFQPTLKIDAEVSFKDLRPELFEAFELLEPFGQGNPYVQLVSRKVRLLGTVHRFGSEQKHARFTVDDGTGRHQVVWWNFPSNLNTNQPFNLAYTPEINNYNGERYYRLKAIDFQQS